MLRGPATVNFWADDLEAPRGGTSNCWASSRTSSARQRAAAGSRDGVSDRVQHRGASAGLHHDLGHVGDVDVREDELADVVELIQRHGGAAFHHALLVHEGAHALLGLRLDFPQILGTTPLLPPLIDPNDHSCGTVRPHGVDEPAHPEPGYYAIGMNSYGRASPFQPAALGELPPAPSTSRQVRTRLRAGSTPWLALPPAHARSSRTRGMTFVA
ncbi:hypothetical protein ACFLIM_45060 [Nonomuraea sp. M3C6]|uniref:Uncharacterized protein n=1 Tax=Nonomuraea marmarensis TaxID=3351344 RepID=A0ABW7AVW9_9ACTN